MKKKCAAALSLLFLLSIFSFAGAHAAPPEPFEGYFENTSYMRSVPKIENTTLKSIPAYTPLSLTPVNEKYASVEYDGVKGYVYYVSALRMPAETPVSGLIVYSDGNKFVLNTPLVGNEKIGMIQPQTPIVPLAAVGGYYKVELDGAVGYIRQKDTKELPADTQIVSREVFTEAKTQVHALPLKNSPVLCTLESRRVYLATARCRGFYKVSWGALEGYVLMDDVRTFQKDSALLSVGLVGAQTPLYSRPDEVFLDPDAARPAENSLCFFDAASNGFYHIADGAYVSAQNVAVYAVEPIATCQLYPKANVSLTLLPNQAGGAAGPILEAGRLYAASYKVGNDYLVQADGAWGFAAQSAVECLLAGEMMNRTAAVVSACTTLYFSDGKTESLAPDTKIFLTRRAESFCFCEANGKSGFVLLRDVTLLSADVPVDSYQVPAFADIALMDFPDKALSQSAGTIHAGEIVTVTGFNRCYLLVSCGSLSGYAPQDGLLSAETEGMPQTENIPRYELVLDKSTRMVYAFVLDENGLRTDEIAQSARVAVGKRTTPTPSGTFTLGRKERWHRFTRSYTPHTTVYDGGRYIHGLPCLTKSDASVIDYLAHSAGQAVTGGCLRSPFSFARWVYMNCPSYQTTLTVVSGGLILPGAQTPAPLPSPCAEPEEIPDEGGEPENDETDAALPSESTAPAAEDETPFPQTDG